MIFRNYTDVPFDKPMEIAEFCDPDKFMNQTGIIVVKYKTKYDPFYGTFVKKAKNGFPQITLWIKRGDIDLSLVCYLAHEFRHMWQWDFCSFLWDSEKRRIAKGAKEMQEKDAHGYTIAMMKIHYKENWDWKTLPDLKKEYSQGLMLEDLD